MIASCVGVGIAAVSWQSADRIHGEAAQRARRIDAVDQVLRLDFDDRIHAGLQAGEMVDSRSRRS